MIHQMRNRFFGHPVVTMLSLALILTATASAAKNQTLTGHNSLKSAPAQQPLYSEYRGVRVGMTPEQVRAKLGEPVQKADDGDFFVFSENETAQIAYNKSHVVKVISIDFAGGVGAPDYKLVVGPDVEVKPDGAIYKSVRYEAAGLWVFYNRTGGESPVVTITIQKSPLAN